MTIAGEDRITLRRGSADILPLRDLDWDTALDLAESLARSSSGRNCLSFLDARLIIRCLVDPATRNVTVRHLLLPQDGRWARLSQNLLGLRRTATRFSPDAFIAALLTRAERKLRISVAVEQPGQAERVRDILARHAPWHEISVFSGQDDTPADILLVFGPRGRPGRMGSWNGAHSPANLTIFSRTSLQLR